MATEIKTWEIVEGKLYQLETTLAENKLTEKDHLEQWIKTNPEILGSEYCYHWGAGKNQVWLPGFPSS